MDMNGTLGAAFIGNIVGAILFGITTLQAFIYFKTSPEDRWSFKLLIGFLWLLGAIQIAFMTEGVYCYVVLNFNNPTVIQNIPWAILSQVIITCLSDTIVRGIFARRIWLLSGRNKSLLFCIMFTTLVVFVSGNALAIRGIINVSYAQLILDSWLLYIALGSVVLADILIATSICVLLYHSRSGFKSSDSLVNTLMLYSINTGMLTSFCAMACCITFAIWPRTFVFMGIYFVLSKLYINTILAVLNTRSLLRKRTTGVATIPMSPSAIEPLSFLPTLSNHGHAAI